MFPAYDYLSAYDRHKKLINDYFELRGGSALSLQRDTSRDKTDYDVIRENHKFLWDDETDTTDTWATRLAKKYYDKLFKEYCICDLTYYKHNKVALRWRTEKEVVVGKGQFECGSKHCSTKESLRTWEVNFGYEEHGEKKNALVKLRLCPECSLKLNYKSEKREIKRKKHLKRLGKDTVEDTERPSRSTEVAKTEIKTEPESEPESTGEAQNSKVAESDIWRSKPKEGVEKSREDEFEEYLADLFL